MAVCHITVKQDDNEKSLPVMITGGGLFITDFTSLKIALYAENWKRLGEKLSCYGWSVTDWGNANI